MGHRTIVCLYNDQMHEWSRDPVLGSLISTAASMSLSAANQGRELDNYGRILETSHADTQRLAVIDSYTMTTLALGHWTAGPDMQKMRDIALIKMAAEKLGYKLVKK